MISDVITSQLSQLIGLKAQEDCQRLLLEAVAILNPCSSTPRNKKSASSVYRLILCEFNLHTSIISVYPPLIRQRFTRESVDYSTLEMA